MTVVRCLGGALNTLVLDGLFTVAAEDGGVQFHATPPPTDAGVAEQLTAIRARIERLLTRHDLGPRTPGC